jgi:hypothetical protein
MAFQTDSGSPTASQAQPATQATVTGPAGTPIAAESVGLTPQQVQAALVELRRSQSLVAGSFAGVLAALAGAAIWAIITAVSGYQIGYMAIGVGLLVGVAIRAAGKGIDKQFGYLGAALSLVGCLAGNLLAMCIMAAHQLETPLMEILGSLSPKMIGQIMFDTAHPMDFLFYGIAVMAGYSYSFRRVTAEDVRRFAPAAAPMPQTSQQA